MRFQLYLAPMLATLAMAFPKMANMENGMMAAEPETHEEKKLEQRDPKTPWVKREYIDGYYEDHAYISPGEQCEEREDNGKCDDKEEMEAAVKA